MYKKKITTIVFMLMLIGLLFLIGNESRLQSENALPNYLEKYIDELVQKLGADDWQMREEATDQLIAIGPIIRKRIEKELANPDAEIKLRAVQIGFALKWKEAFTSRIDKFVGQIRKRTITDQAFLQQSFQFLSGDESIYMFTDLLKDAGQPPELRRMVVQSLQSAHNINLKPILPDLIQLWQNEKDQTIRYAVLQSFTRVGKDERVISILMKELKEGDYNSQVQAISILGQLREELAIPEILKLLYSGNDNMRNTALYALNNFRTPQIFEELVKAWKKEKTQWLRVQYLSVLAGFQDKRLLPELLEIARNEKDAQLLQNISYSLYQFQKYPETAAIALALLKNGDANVRANVLNFLKSYKEKSVIPELINMLSAETDFSSFNTLADVLQGISGERFMPQQVPAELKGAVLKSCREWWEKNKQ